MHDLVLRLLSILASLLRIDIHIGIQSSVQVLNAIENIVDNLGRRHLLPFEEWGHLIDREKC
jgi:hypothetical protein